MYLTNLEETSKQNSIHLEYTGRLSFLVEGQFSLCFLRHDNVRRSEGKTPRILK
jgi:hypothetical protein